MKNLRAAWPEQTAGIKPEDFVFMDESGINGALTRLFARSLCGTRAFGFVPRNWGDNVSILGALTLRGHLEVMCVNGATDGRVFLTYLKGLLVPQLWPGAVVVLDNLGAHKVKGGRETIGGGECPPALPATLQPRLQPNRNGLVQTQEPPAQSGRADQRSPGSRHR